MFCHVETNFSEMTNLSGMGEVTLSVTENNTANEEREETTGLKHITNALY